MFWTYPPKHFTQFCGIRFPWLDFYTLSTVAFDKPIARFESLVGGKYIFKGQCFCYCVFETYFRTQQNFGVHWPRTPPYGSGFSGKSSAPRYVAKLLWEINDFYIVENVSPHTRATPPSDLLKQLRSYSWTGFTFSTSSKTWLFFVSGPKIPTGHYCHPGYGRTVAGREAHRATGQEDPKIPVAALPGLSSVPATLRSVRCCIMHWFIDWLVAQVAETFTGTPGKLVTLKDTITGFNQILDGELMCFYFTEVKISEQV